MGFGVLRTLIRPISRTLIARASTSYPTPFLASSPLPKPELRSLFGASLHLRSPWAPTSSLFHSLTDTRLPKRRPSNKPRRKRASLKPSGPIAWIKTVPGEPVRNQPNQGSVKRRNEKKREKQRREFILAEKKKRKAELQEANRKKMIKRVDRKMSAVARERAWAERLAEMQRLQEAYKKAGTPVDTRTLLEATLYLANN